MGHFGVILHNIFQTNVDHTMGFAKVEGTKAVRAYMYATIILYI